MMPLRHVLTAWLVLPSARSSSWISFASCMILSAGEVFATSGTSAPGLEEDMSLTTHNLGTKLMRWMSSFDCDRVGVDS